MSGELHVFLSHSHRDRPIVDALVELFEELFGKAVTFDFSSDQSAGGGIRPGESWLEWIIHHIDTADRTFVLLTPNSIATPWILWEAGVSFGVVLGQGGAGTAHEHPGVVPITYGLELEHVPAPFRTTQFVKGEVEKGGGIERLLATVDRDLGTGVDLASPATRKSLRRYRGDVAEALRKAPPAEPLLAAVPEIFGAEKLAGLWVTAFEFLQGTDTLHHADVTRVDPVSERRLVATNAFPEPRTEGRNRPFRNLVDAEVANRHLIGHWRNVSDQRYFGGLQLAVDTGECVMEGWYTSYAGDVTVERGHWKWVKLDPASVRGGAVKGRQLRDPVAVHGILRDYDPDAGSLSLGDVTVGV